MNPRWLWKARRNRQSRPHKRVSRHLQGTKPPPDRDRSPFCRPRLAEEPRWLVHEDGVKERRTKEDKSMRKKRNISLGVATVAALLVCAYGFALAQASQ